MLYVVHLPEKEILYREDDPAEESYKNLIFYLLFFFK